MTWDNLETKYWDIGEENIITLTNARLAKIMKALILCEGKLHSSFCMEKERGTTKLRYPERSCAVIVRISLPVGSEEEFEELSGCKLSEPPIVRGS